MPMMATILLADAAQAIDNKLYILGGGWSVTGPDPSPSALAIALKVPWDEANRRHDLRVELLDSDGQPVRLGSAEEGQRFVIESNFEVGRPPGLRPGTPIDLGARDQPRPGPAPAGRPLRVAAEHRRAQRVPLARRVQHAPAAGGLKPRRRNLAAPARARSVSASRREHHGKRTRSADLGRAAARRGSRRAASG